MIDVYPDGRAYNLDESIQRVRYRNGYDKPLVWMEDGKVTKVTFQPLNTSNFFETGHRLRIEISSSNFPRFDRNLNTGGRNYDETKAVVAHNSVHHSSAVSVGGHAHGGEKAAAVGNARGAAASDAPCCHGPPSRSAAGGVLGGRPLATSDESAPVTILKSGVSNLHLSAAALGDRLVVGTRKRFKHGQIGLWGEWSTSSPRGGGGGTLSQPRFRVVALTHQGRIMGPIDDRLARMAGRSD